MAEDTKAIENVRLNTKTLTLAGVGKTVTQGENWLKGEKRGTYELALSQAYSSASLGLEALQAKASGDERLAADLSAQTGAIVNGTTPTPVPFSHSREVTAAAQKEDARFTVVVKSGTILPMGVKKRHRRDAKIKQGKMFIYQNCADSWRACKQYGAASEFNLADLITVENDPQPRYRLELSTAKNLREKFLSGYKARVTMKFPSMPGKFFYLYTDTEEEGQGIIGQIKMARHLQNELIVNKLRMACNRMVSLKAGVAIDTLMAAYNQEREERELLRKFVANLLNADLARGWKKWRHLYRMRQREAAEQEETKRWAAKLMTEKLMDVKAGQVKTTDDLRDEVISAIQAAFKQVRRVTVARNQVSSRDMGPPMSAVMRSKDGVDCSLQFESLSRTAVLQLAASQTFVGGAADNTERAWTRVGEARAKLADAKRKQEGVPPAKKAAVDAAAEAVEAAESHLAEMQKGVEGFHKDAHKGPFLMNEYVKSREMPRKHAPTFEEADVCYSDCGRVPLERGSFFMSDGLDLGKFIVGNVDQSAHKHMNKAEFSYFFRTKNISSIILNSERVNATPKTGAAEVMHNHLDTGKGHWLTICGPAISWGRGLRKGLSVEKNHELAGNLQKQRNERYSSLHCISVTIQATSGEFLFKEIEGSPVRPTLARIHAFGRQSQSNLTDGKGANQKWGATLQVQLPRLNDNDDQQYLAHHYDEQMVSIEMVEKTSDGDYVVVMQYQSTLGKLIGRVRAEQPGSLGDMMSKVSADYYGDHHASNEVPLAPPDHAMEEIQQGKPSPRLNVRVTVRDNTSAPPDAIISPQLAGVGGAGHLFSSHKGAYFDDRLGAQRFDVAHVGNSIEVQIGELMMQNLRNDDEDLRAGDERPRERYFVKVQCGESSRCTRPRIRARKKWMDLDHLITDQRFPIDQTVTVPLPIDLDTRDFVDVQLFSIRTPTREYSVSPGWSAHQFPTSSTSDPTVKLVGHGKINMQRVVVDNPHKLQIWLNRPSEKGPSVVRAFNSVADAACIDNGAPCLTVTVALRDRDEARGLLRDDLLYVGDSALLHVEQVLSTLLPKSNRGEQDWGRFRRMYGGCTGVDTLRYDRPTDENLEKAWSHAKNLKKEWKDTVSKCSDKEEKKKHMRKYLAKNFEESTMEKLLNRKELALRDPTLQGELEAAQVDQIPDFEFTQHTIPDYCRRPVPFKFVAAPNEADHIARGCPGDYARVMEARQAEYDETKKKDRDGLNRLYMCNSLTHNSRDFPCTIVAVQPCIAGEGREAFAGCYLTIEVPLSALNSDDCDTQFLLPGNAKVERETHLRIERVHSSMLHSLEHGGFSLYDAKFERISDVKPVISTSSEYAMTAGVLPFDANPAICTYEWKLYIQAANEAEMYKTAHMIREATRVEAAQTYWRLQHRPRAVEATVVKQEGDPRKGIVELVVVECSRVRDPLNSRWLDVTQRAERYVKGLKPVNVAVTMKVVGPSGDKLFRTQECPKIPVLGGETGVEWSEVPGLGLWGGFMFRTAMLHLDTHGDARVALTINDRKIDGPANTTVPGTIFELGTVHIPVAELMSVENPFQNRWFTLDCGDPDSRTELRVMTRFATCKPSALDVNLPSAKAYLMALVEGAAEIRSKFKCPVPEDPYNPNVPGQAGLSERRAPELWQVQLEYKKLAFDALARHECSQLRAAKFWSALRAKVGTKSLGEVRVAPASNEELRAVFAAGIPDAERINAWLEVSQGKRVRGKFTETHYRLLVEETEKGMISVACRQLSEDYHAMRDSSEAVVPEVQAVHLATLARALEICKALIFFSQQDSGMTTLHFSQFRGATAVAYSNSLLVLAYHMCALPSRDHEIFWLLFTLTGHTESNGSYDGYWGAPKRTEMPNPQGGPKRLAPGLPICSASAAMFDVLFLETALAVDAPEVYKKIVGTSFSLAQYFYGAFMKLFAGMLPETALYRLWDRLMFDSADRSSPTCVAAAPLGPRHALVELAFAALTMTRVEGGIGLPESIARSSSTEQLEKAIESAFRVFDSEKIRDLIEYGASRLWGLDPLRAAIRSTTYTEASTTWKNYSLLFQFQSEAIKQLVHNVPSFHDTTRQVDTPLAMGMTTEILHHQIIPALWEAFEVGTAATTDASRITPDGKHPQECAGLYRPVPEALRAVTAATSGGPVGMVATTARKAVWTSLSNLVGYETPVPVIRPIPVEPPGLMRDARIERRFAVKEMESTSHGNVSGVQRMRRVFPAWSEKEIGDVFDRYSRAGRKKKVLGNVVDPRGNVERNPISMLEVISSIIILSAGTVTEKALALFHLYRTDQTQTRGAWVHQTKVPRSVDSTIRRIDRVTPSLEVGGEGPSEFSDSVPALVFTIWTTASCHDGSGQQGSSTGANVAGKRNVKGVGWKVDEYELGKAYVRDYRQLKSALQPKRCILVIWGNNHEYVHPEFHGKPIGRVVVDLRLAITDAGSESTGYAAGRLQMFLTEVSFEYKFGALVADKINPRVSVDYYKPDSYKSSPLEQTRGQSGHPNDYSSWKLTTLPRKYEETFDPMAGGRFLFRKSMTESLSQQFMGKIQNQKIGKLVPKGRGCGFQQPLSYIFNADLGKRESGRLLVSHKQLEVKPGESSESEELISLHATRIIVMSVLQRCLHPVSNRQAILLADSVFSRGGVAPAIFDAYVIRIDESYSYSEQSLEISLEAAKAQNTWTDVYHLMGPLWDEQVNINHGSVDLWKIQGSKIKFVDPLYVADSPFACPVGYEHVAVTDVTLTHLLGAEYYSGYSTALFLRSRRAGDGAITQTVLRFKDKTLHEIDGVSVGSAIASSMRRSALLEMDLEKPPDVSQLVVGTGSGSSGPWRSGDGVHKQLMFITKSEFLASMLACPLLSESLRRMTSADTKMRKNNALSFNVDIDTGTGDADFADIFDSGRKVLLEVWDHDQVTGNDFLGEVWLESMEDLAEKQQLVLNFGDSTERSRMGDYCEGYTIKLPKGKQTATIAVPPTSESMHTSNKGRFLGSKTKGGAKGKLYLSAKWSYPQTPEELSKELADAEPGQDLNPKLKAEKDRALNTGTLALLIKRAEDLRVADLKSSDPFIRIWAFNEHGGSERKKWRWIGDTAYKSKTLNPVYNEEWRIGLYNGQYEARMDRVGVTTARAKTQNVPLEFGPGARHGVEIYPTDSVEDALFKMQKAINVLAEERPASGGFSDYAGIEIQNSGHNKHVLLGFVPQHEMAHRRRIDKVGANIVDAAKGDDAAKRMQRTVLDENNWEPLCRGDMIGDYAFRFKFGYPDETKGKQSLRLLEGTDAYARKNRRFQERRDKEKAQITNDRTAQDDTDGCYGFAQKLFRGVPTGLQSSTRLLMWEWRPAIFKYEKDRMTATWLCPTLELDQYGRLELHAEEETFDPKTCNKYEEDAKGVTVSTPTVLYAPQFPLIGKASSDTPLDADPEVRDIRTKISAKILDYKRANLPVGQVVQILNDLMFADFELLKQRKPDVEEPRPYKFEQVQEIYRMDDATNKKKFAAKHAR